MGLDQYALSKSPEGEVSEIAYWRKHNALHGWMENLWNAKGRPESNGDGDVFNGIQLELTATDLDMLHTVVISNNLPETDGFFFGVDTRHFEGKKNETLVFIEKAKKLLEDGHGIRYNSWW
jgi:hypothetical protein